MDNIDLKNDQVYSCLAPELPLPGVFRLLEMQPRINGATVIAIPESRERGDGQQKYYYARGFKRVELSKLRKWFNTGLIKESTLELPPLWLLSDEQLNTQFASKTESGCKASALVTRDFKWSLIEPLVPVPLGTGTTPIDLSYLDSLVKERTKAAGVSAGQVYDALHRFYAFYCTRNSLLPNRAGRCGNPGQKRVGKNSKLGRKNTAAKLGDEQRRGLILTHQDIQNIEDAFQLIGPGVTTEDAYVQMGKMFYSSHIEHKNGVPMPVLLPANLRPTYSEFTYRGKQANADGGAARRIMGDGEWLKNYRPLSGTATDGIVAIGQTGSIDASPNDVHNVSFTNPCQSIGVGRTVFVRDVYSGLVVGWSMSINNPTVQDAKLAILRAAESKVKHLKKYGLNHPEGDFPSIFFARYHSDNGELRCKDGLLTIGNELKRSIEFIPSSRADLNSISEAGHQGRHKNLDRKLPGTTFGRPHKRGETLPIENAVLSRHAYMRLMLDWVHWHNVRQQLPIKEIPAEMRRDFAARNEKVPLNRLGIFKWAVANGYVIGRPLTSDMARAHLLPRYKASLSRNGIVLHRPATGNAIELLPGARFNDAYLVESGMMQAAMRRKVTHVEVSADPDDLSCIYIIDQEGIHRIPNIIGDALLIKEGTMSDLCSLNDEQRLSNVLTAGQVDQDNADLSSLREETVKTEKEHQKAYAAGTNTQHVQKSQRGIKAAQEDEKKTHLDAAIDAVASTPEASNAPKQEARDFVQSDATTTPAMSSLDQFRMRQLMEFQREQNNERTKRSAS